MTTGHHSDGSSIQNHSVGGHYPFILVFQEGAVNVQAPSGEWISTFFFSEEDPQERRAAYAAATDEACECAERHAAFRTLLAFSRQ